MAEVVAMEEKVMGSFYLCQSEEGEWFVVQEVGEAEAQGAQKVEAIGNQPRDLAHYILRLGQQLAGLSKALANLGDAAFVGGGGSEDVWWSMEILAEEILKKAQKAVAIAREAPPQA